MRSFIASLVLSLTTVMSAHAGVISTLGVPGSDFRCLGTASQCGQTFGQTFTVATPETELDLFTFELANLGAGASLNVIFKLFSWNGVNIVGPSLYQSDVRTFSNTGTNQFATFAPNVNLTQGSSYMAFLDTSGVGNSTAYSSGFVAVSNSAYNGGTFLWQRNSGDAFWNSSFGDSHFSATFSAPAAAVPEPLTLSLLGLGLFGIAATRRRKK